MKIFEQHTICLQNVFQGSILLHHIYINIKVFFYPVVSCYIRNLLLREFELLSDVNFTYADIGMIWEHIIGKHVYNIVYGITYNWSDYLVPAWVMFYKVQKRLNVSIRCMKGQCYIISSKRSLGFAAMHDWGGSCVVREYLDTS